MADEETLDERFLRTFYVLAEGQATQLVSGEELARKPGMDPDGETDKARFLGTARRLEEGYVIANKTGPEVRDNTSLSSTQQASSRRSRRASSHSTSRASWGGDGGSELRPPSGGPTQVGTTSSIVFRAVVGSDGITSVFEVVL